MGKVLESGLNTKTFSQWDERQLAVGELSTSYLEVPWDKNSLEYFSHTRNLLMLWKYILHLIMDAQVSSVSGCRNLGLTALNSLLQYVNWLVWEIVLSTEWSRTRRLDYNDLNWPRCSARVTESLALTDGGFCRRKRLYILDYVNFVRL